MSELEVFYEGRLRTRCVDKGSGDEIRTDAPKDNMGKGERISPTDLLAASWGTCILTLMGMAANKLKVDLSGLRLKLVKEMSSIPPRRIGKLVCDVYCPSQFDSETTQKIEHAATHCPVHQSLHPDIVQEFRFHWGAP